MTRSDAIQLSDAIGDRLGSALSAALDRAFTGPAGRRLAAAMHTYRDRRDCLAFADTFLGASVGATVRGMSAHDARTVAQAVRASRRPAPGDREIDKYRDEIVRCGADFAEVRATYLALSPARRRELLDGFDGAYTGGAFACAPPR